LRSGSFLQRRLLKLESVIKLPDQCEIDKRVVAEALSNLSIEDLHLLRDGADRRASGIAFEASSEYDNVFQRANTLCVQALAEHHTSTGAAG